jgi:hypothetical protein
MWNRQNTGKIIICITKMATRSCEIVAKLKYWEMKMGESKLDSHRNWEQIKFGEFLLITVHNLLSPQLLSKNVYIILIGNCDGKRSLGRSRRGWEVNIKMNPNEIWCCWSEYIWLVAGSSGDVLWTRQRTFRLLNKWGIAYLDERLSASEERLWCLG